MDCSVIDAKTDLQVGDMVLLQTQQVDSIDAIRFIHEISGRALVTTFHFEFRLLSSGKWVNRDVIQGRIKGFLM